MRLATDSSVTTIAGHAFTLKDRAGGVLNLRVALRDGSLLSLARELAKLDGVRVSGGPEGTGRQRCYLVHCLGFKMVLSVPEGEATDSALALVSRTPQVALAVMSDLGSVLEHLMTEPAGGHDLEPKRDGQRLSQRESPVEVGKSSALRRSALDQGRPLARKTPLQRKTPLARGRWTPFPRPR